MTGTVDRHSTSLLIIVSKLGTVTLYACEAGVWETALKGWQVMFCPPFTTWNLTFEVMHPRRSPLIKTFSKFSDVIY